MAADPATLIPYEDSEPIIVGRDHTGTVSHDGSKTVVQTLLSDGSYLITVLETGTWEVLATDQVDTQPRLLTVGDDGAAFWLGGSTGSDLVALEPERDGIRMVTANLLGGFSPLSERITIVETRTLGLVGSHPVDDGELVSAVILSLDGAMTIHDFPKIETEVEVNGEAIPAHSDYVWDTRNERVLVVEATRDIVSELDLETGEISEHPWDGLGPATQRDVALSPDGKLLFIASANLDQEQDGLVRSPQNLVVLDPVGWSSGEIVDIAVDSLYPSPDGVTMLAQGAEVTTTPTDTTRRPSPVYLLDVATAEVALGFQVSDALESPAQYSADGSHVYLATDENGAETYAILDVAQQELVGSAGFNRFSLIGRAGLVSFHQQ